MSYIPASAGACRDTGPVAEPFVYTHGMPLCHCAPGGTIAIQSVVDTLPCSPHVMDTVSAAETDVLSMLMGNAGDGGGLSLCGKYSSSVCANAKSGVASKSKATMMDEIDVLFVMAQELLIYAHCRMRHGARPPLCGHCEENSRLGTSDRKAVR